MMTKKTSSVVMILALATALIGAIGITTGDDGLLLPPKWADAWRIVVMAQAGLSLGLMILLFVQFMRIRVDHRDVLIRPLAALAASYFLLTLYVGYQLVGLLGNQRVTWRTPMSFLAFAISDVALIVLVRRFGNVAVEARRTNAMLKLTMVDTSKPGPDIDLTTKTQVV